MNRCGSREPLSLIGVASPAGLWETIAKTDDETTLNVIAASPLRLLFSLSILQLLVCFSKLLRTTEFKMIDILCYDFCMTLAISILLPFHMPK